MRPALFKAEVEAETSMSEAEAKLLTHAPCGPGTIPLIPSLPHRLLYLSIYFTFRFLTRFIYFLAFPPLPILQVTPCPGRMS